MNSVRVAVMQFPGVNCEYETVRAAASAGLEAEIFRWNQDPDRLSDYDGYILPGGFSYQDRVRAGVIAAKAPVMDVICEGAAKGKPVLGICNGAQVLVESGLVPGLHPEQVEMALAPNRVPGHSGYLCRWVYIKVPEGGSHTCATCAFRPGDIIPMPIAHAEGRFWTKDEAVLDALGGESLVAFRYCGPDGQEGKEFPLNPNGSLNSIAGLSNREGNVCAMMPHPERATWLRQVPDCLDSSWGKSKTTSWGEYGKMEEAGPGHTVFESFATYLGGEPKCGHWNTI